MMELTDETHLFANDKQLSLVHDTIKLVTHHGYDHVQEDDLSHESSQKEQEIQCALHGMLVKCRRHIAKVTDREQILVPYHVDEEIVPDSFNDSVLCIVWNTLLGDVHNRSEDK